MRLAALILASLFACSPAIAQVRELRVGVYQNSPKVFVDEAGQAQGIFVDLLTQVARSEGWQIRYVSCAWLDCLQLLSAGELDLLPDVALTEPREKLYDFHAIPALLSWSQLYRRPDVNVVNYMDLDSKRIAVLEGSVQQRFLAELLQASGLQATMLPVASLEEAFAMTARGEADVVAANQQFGDRHMLGLGLRDTAILFNPARLYFAARKGSDPTVLQAIDHWLRNNRDGDDAAYKRILLKWGRGEQAALMSPVVWWVGGGLLTLLLLFIGGNFWLRREVARKVASLEANERELARHRDHLEEMITQRTAELDKARREAEHLARVKSEFLANMSHEIRTPLNGVLGLAQVGVRRFKQDEVQKAFAGIIDSGKLLQRVLDDILDFSKIEAGKLRVDASQFAIDDMLSNVMLLIRERAESKGLALLLERQADLPECCIGDAFRIQQVLLNLLSNAVKFTDAGSVTLRAGLADGMLLFSVADTGIGISEDEQRSLFQPFAQADSSITRRFGGTGLGLVISQRLVELMHGRLELSSTLGKGSVFTVRLPYVPVIAPAIQVPAPVPPAAPVKGALVGMSVLVVDDNEINRMVLEDLLLQEGARVTLASDGASAIDLVRAGESAFDVVLMDIMMPGMDGFAATRLLHELSPSLPVIGQTAYAEESDRAKCLEAGMLDRVTKPIDSTGLVALLLRHVKVNPGADGKDSPPRPAG